MYACVSDSVAPLQPDLEQLAGHVRHAHDGHVSYPALAQVDLLKRTGVYVCMYVCMCVCMCVYVYAWVYYVCMYVCVNRECIYIRTHVCMYLYVYFNEWKSARVLGR